MTRIVRLVVLSLAVILSSADARAGDALIAVATNFADTARVLAAAYAGEAPHSLDFTHASTGVLYAQITQGAPFDALLAADEATPRRLESQGVGVAGSRFRYATGQLVLWSADAARIGADGRAALADPEVRHVAIANPRLAPYGEAARQTLVSLGLWSTLEPRLVMGQNVGQAQAMVATGAAELGFIAMAGLVDAPPKQEGSHWVVAPGLFDPIRQEAILLQHGRDNEAARAFLDFLRSEPARAIIRERGYAIEPEVAERR